MTVFSLCLQSITLYRIAYNGLCYARHHIKWHKDCTPVSCTHHCNAFRVNSTAHCYALDTLLHWGTIATLRHIELQSKTYTTLIYTALHFTTLQYTSIYHTTLHYYTLLNAVIHYSTLYHTILYYTTQLYTTFNCVEIVDLHLVTSNCLTLRTSYVTLRHRHEEIPRHGWCFGASSRLR